MTGARPEAAAAQLQLAGADVIGTNCGSGIDHFVTICQRLRTACDKPLWIKPNAGLPVMEDGILKYRQTPADFAGYLPALLEAGASFVGGCCGTSPDFIRALKEAFGSCASV